MSAIALVTVFPRIGSAAPTNSTLADGIDDLWALVRVPLKMARGILPQPRIDGAGAFESEKLFARVAWLNPRIHPWRFACVLGFLAGACLIAAEAQEGPPPDVATGLLVAAIFLSVELTATLLGFAVFGRYLGLRRAPESGA